MKLAFIPFYDRNFDFLAAPTARHDNPTERGIPGRRMARLDSCLIRFEIVFHPHYYSNGKIDTRDIKGITADVQGH